MAALYGPALTASGELQSSAATYPTMICFYANGTWLKKLPFRPVSFLLKARFDNLRTITAVGCPVLIGHGRRDRVIPSRMGEKLAAAARGPVTTVWIDRAGHKHLFDVGGDQIERAIGTFISMYFVEVR